jgi:hypothetical protein
VSSCQSCYSRTSHSLTLTSFCHISRKSPIHSRTISRRSMAAIMKKVDFKLPPMADKVTSLFHPRRKASPVFNKPLADGCPHHRLSRILYAVFLPFLIFISVPVVLLKAMTYSFIEDNRDTGFMFETTERDGSTGETLVMAALPRMLYHAPAKLALVAAVLSIALGAAHLGFVAVDWRSAKRVRTLFFFTHIHLLILLRHKHGLSAATSCSSTSPTPYSSSSPSSPSPSHASRPPTFAMATSTFALPQ